MSVYVRLGEEIMKAAILILILGSTSARAQFEGLKNVLSALSSDYEQAPYRILKEFDVRNRKLCRKRFKFEFAGRV